MSGRPQSKVFLPDLLPVSKSYEIVDSLEFLEEGDDVLQFDFTIKILDVDEFYKLSFARVLFEKKWFLKFSDLYFDDFECSYYIKYRITQKAEIVDISK